MLNKFSNSECQAIKLARLLFRFVKAVLTPPIKDRLLRGNPLFDPRARTFKNITARPESNENRVMRDV